MTNITFHMIWKEYIKEKKVGNESVNKKRKMDDW